MILINVAVLIFIALTMESFENNIGGFCPCLSSE